MNSLPADFPTNLQDAIAYFADPGKAFAAAVALRWPNGITCPRCESKEHSFISTRKIWFCKGCKKQFTVKLGSIFEDSPLGMDKWMFATWLVSNCKNGVSSCEIARHLGITQKSAWFMDHRIRHAMHTGSFGNKFSGQIEADETFIGGKARNMHASTRAVKISGTGPRDKAAVLKPKLFSGPLAGRRNFYRARICQGLVPAFDAGRRSRRIDLRTCPPSGGSQRDAT